MNSCTAVEVVDDAVAVADRQPPRLQRVVGRRLQRRREALARADAVDDQPQLPGRGDPRVLLPQRAGGGVARVGEGRLAGLDQAGVEGGELLDREEDLAADLDLLGYVAAGQPGRDPLQGAHVEGDVLAGHAVAAGECAHQPAALVEQVDGDAVDLELAQVVHVGTARVALDPLGPRGQLVGAERVVQAHHPLEVVGRREVGREGAADGLRRRVGRAQLGVRLLDLLQLAHPAVVLRVGDGRRVAQEVVEARLVDQLDQLGVPVRGLLRVSRRAPSLPSWSCGPLIPPGPRRAVGRRRRRAAGRPGRGPGRRPRARRSA